MPCILNLLLKIINKILVMYLSYHLPNAVTSLTQLSKAVYSF